MSTLMMQDNKVRLTKVQMVKTEGGAIQKVLSTDSDGYRGFGEAYLTSIEHGVVRAWKFHKEMVLNLIATRGVIRFVCMHNNHDWGEYILSEKTGERLVVPSKTWFGFQGLSVGGAQILNIANIRHDPGEILRAPREQFDFTWDK